MRSFVLALGAVGLLAVATPAQTPQPFPRPGAAQPPRTPTPAPAAPAAPPAPAAPASPAAPDLGVPVYPSAVYLASYDAGRGQRFYLFGVLASYMDMVNYYKTVLKNNGDELFEAPPTHQFEIGRFRSESMTFPPSVTVKDYTYGGSAGYPNPRPGATPARFPTIIQIVPVPKL